MAGRATPRPDSASVWQHGRRGRTGAAGAARRPARPAASTPTRSSRRLRRLPFADVGDALVDHHRALRQGLPEAVYGPGKTPEQCVRIVGELLDHGTAPVLLTRASDDQAEGRRRRARTRRCSRAGACSTGSRTTPRAGRVLVVTAGTADRPVADECLLTLHRPRLRAGPARRRRRRRAAPPARPPRRRSPPPTPSSCSPGWRARWPASIGGLTGAPVVAVPDQRRLRRVARGRHRAAGDARLVRQRRHRRRHRQRLRRGVRDRPDAAVTRRVAYVNCSAGVAGDMLLGALVDAGADPDEVAATVAGLGVDGYALDVRAGPARRHRRRRAPTSSPTPHGHDAPAGVGRSSSCSTPPTSPSAVRGRRPAACSPCSPRPRAPCTASIPTTSSCTRSARSTPSSTSSASSPRCTRSASSASSSSPIAIGHGVVRGQPRRPAQPAAGRRPPARQPRACRSSASRRRWSWRRRPASPCSSPSPTASAPLPAMTRRARSATAPGTADPPGRPNVVQVLVGTRDRGDARRPGPGAPAVQLEVNVDDVTGEVLAHTIAALLAAGAHDAWATPIVMKKGRPAHTVAALVDPADAERLAAVLLAETGSLGIRAVAVERWPQQRARDRRRRRRSPDPRQGRRRAAPSPSTTTPSQRPPRSAARCATCCARRRRLALAVEPSVRRWDRSRSATARVAAARRHGAAARRQVLRRRRRPGRARRRQRRRQVDAAAADRRRADADVGHAVDRRPPRRDAPARRRRRRRGRRPADGARAARVARPAGAAGVGAGGSPTAERGAEDDPMALRQRPRRLGRPRRLRRRGALGRVPHPRRRASPSTEVDDAAAAHVLRRRAEAHRPGGAAARRRRHPAARRARQLPRRARQALARARAAQHPQDGALRQPRPRAAGGDGDEDRHGRGRGRVDARRRLRRLRRGPPGAASTSSAATARGTTTSASGCRRSSPRCAGGRRSPTRSRPS